jgi:methyl-accepting chemotaxis protein
VEELQINSQDAVSTMAKIAQITKEQTESISKSEEKYKLIDDAMKECQQAVTELNVLGKKMVEMKNVILNTMENLSAIAEENSAATQEVTSATIEQVASMKALSEASENLSQLAQDLQCTVSQFKI